MKITKDDVKEFRNTENGMKKLLWLKIGVVIDLVFTIAVCLLERFSESIPSSLLHTIILYVFLVIIVIGAEFIGTYFGALEQYCLTKKVQVKKEIDIDN